VSYPALDQLRRMQLRRDPGDEVLDSSTFVEAEQRLRGHLDDVRLVLDEFRRYDLRPNLDDCELLCGDARYAWLIATFAGIERGQRMGRERAERMIHEARRYAENSVSAAAPWLGDDDD